MTSPHWLLSSFWLHFWTSFLSLPDRLDAAFSLDADRHHSCYSRAQRASGNRHSTLTSRHPPFNQAWGSQWTSCCSVYTYCYSLNPPVYPTFLSCGLFSLFLLLNSALFSIQNSSLCIDPASLPLLASWPLLTHLYPFLWKQPHLWYLFDFISDSRQLTYFSTKMSTPTLINLPPPRSESVTPSDMGP